MFLQSVLLPKLAAADAKCTELSHQIDLLQGQLEKVGTAGGAQDEVLKFLRREKETLSVEVSLLKQERARWKKQAETAQEVAADAKARLESALKSKADTVRGEEEHKALLNQVEQLNILRESNSTLRGDLEKKSKQLQEWMSKAQTGSKSLETLRKDNILKAALIKAAEAEKRSLAGESARWEKRCNQLLEKHGQVDLAEHKRILAMKEKLQKENDAGSKKLAAVQKEVEATKQKAVKLAADLEHSKKQERIAKNREKLFNPEGMTPSGWKERESKKAQEQAKQKKELDGVQAQLKALQAKVTGEKAQQESELSKQVTTLSATLKATKAKSSELLEKYKKLLEQDKQNKTKLKQYMLKLKQTTEQNKVLKEGLAKIRPALASQEPSPPAKKAKSAVPKPKPPQAKKAAVKAAPPGKAPAPAAAEPPKAEEKKVEPAESSRTAALAAKAAAQAAIKGSAVATPAVKEGEEAKAPETAPEPSAAAVAEETEMPMELEAEPPLLPLVKKEPPAVAPASEGQITGAKRQLSGDDDEGPSKKAARGEEATGPEPVPAPAAEEEPAAPGADHPAQPAGGNAPDQAAEAFLQEVLPAQEAPPAPKEKLDLAAAPFAPFRAKSPIAEPEAVPERAAEPPPAKEEEAADAGQAPEPEAPAVEAKEAEELAKAETPQEPSPAAEAEEDAKEEGEDDEGGVEEGELEAEEAPEASAPKKRKAISWAPSKGRGASRGGKAPRGKKKR